MRERFREYVRVSYQIDFSEFQEVAQTERVRKLMDFFENSGKWSRMRAQHVFSDYKPFVWRTFGGCLSGDKYAWYCGIIFKHPSGAYIAVMVPWVALPRTGEIQQHYKLVSSRELNDPEINAFADELLNALKERAYYIPKAPSTLINPDIKIT